MKELVARMAGTGFLVTGLLAAVYIAPAMRPTSDEIVVQDVTKTIAATLESRPLAMATRSEIYFQAVLDRPVFAPTRRPTVTDAIEDAPEEVAPATQVVATTTPDMLLLGVLSGGESSKLLVSVSGGSPIWVTKGDEIDGWTLTDAGADWAEVSQNQMKFRLDLYQ